VQTINSPNTWKTSRYTRALGGQDGDGLLYNGFSGATMRLSPRLYHRVTDLLAASPPDTEITEDFTEDPLFPHLVAGSFVVESKTDELRILEETYEKERQDSQFLLTIFPTFSCNLGCAYCFVGKKSGVMTTQKQEALVQFVTRQLDAQKPPGMAVDWMGGEPLLASRPIASLSQKFQQLCLQRDIPYSAQVISNGTVITEKTPAFLDSCGIRRIQITLDGPAEIHDQRRFYKHGAPGSFGHILEGLEHLVGKFLLRLRINVDDENLNQVWSLLDLFDERGWLGPDKEFYPYLARISPFTDACSGVTESTCSQTNFHDVHYKWMQKLNQLGVPVATQGLYHFPDRKLYNCGAVGLNGFVISPAGELHKCGLTIDDSHEKVGDLGTTLDFTQSVMSKWRNYSPFQNEGCRQCQFLPSCLGGCPRNHLDNRELEKAENCTFHKQFENKIILNHLKLLDQTKGVSV